jgi:hypothetical protein
VVQFLGFPLAALRVLPLHYAAGMLRKWLIIRALQKSAKIRVFPLTAKVYMLKIA